MLHVSYSMYLVKLKRDNAVKKKKKTCKIFLHSNCTIVIEQLRFFKSKQFHTISQRKTV